MGKFKVQNDSKHTTGQQMCAYSNNSDVSLRFAFVQMARGKFKF